jgi:hypothetical protein
MSFGKEISSKLPFSCKLKERKIYQSFSFRALLDDTENTVNYYASEQNQKGEILFSESGVRGFSQVESDLVLVLNDKSVVRVNNNILITTEPVKGFYGEKELECQASSVPLELKLPSTDFDELTTPGETKLVGNTKQKHWTSSDGRLAIKIIHYPSLPVASNTHVQFVFFGNVSGVISKDECDIDYVFYNPNNRKEKKRFIETVLNNAEDVTALKAIFKPFLQSEIVTFYTFFTHRNLTRFSMNFSEKTQCTLRAEN